MTQVQDSFIRSIEDRIQVIRAKLYSLPEPIPAIEKHHRAIDQDFVNLMRWRIEIAKMVGDLEKLVIAGPTVKQPWFTAEVQAQYEMKKRLYEDMPYGEQP